jgi:hypothetical protein
MIFKDVFMDKFFYELTPAFGFPLSLKEREGGLRG